MSHGLFGEWVETPCDTERKTDGAGTIENNGTTVGRRDSCGYRGDMGGGGLSQRGCHYWRIRGMCVLKLFSL